MFEFIRNHQRLMQFVLLLLVLPPFVLVGMGDMRDRASNEGVASVAGQSISQQEFETAQRNRMDQERQRLGSGFDPKVYETPEARQAVLDQLVAQRAVQAEIERNHVVVPVAAIQARQLEMFAQFRKPDGGFDYAQYKQALKEAGLTPDIVDDRIRRELVVQRLTGAIQDTAFAPRAVTGRLLDINDQEREVQEIVFPAANYAAQVKVTDDMVKAYYDKHPQEFQVPEQVKAEYVVFAPAVEKRSASHILFQVQQGAPAAEEAAAKAKAEAALAEVTKNPADFEKVAKAQSQDPESAERGGDLGPIERNVFSKPVEEAIYSLKEGQTSLVRSEFGFHVVKVTKVVSPDSGGKAVADGKKAQTPAEQAEAFRDLVYEQSDSLKPAADKLGLTIKTVEGLTRTPDPKLASEPYNHPKFLQALFTPDVLKNKHNTEAVEIAPGTVISGRVVEFKPAARRPLADVAADIRQRVTQEEAVRLARQAGEAKIAAAKGGDVAGFGEAKIVSRNKPPTIPVPAALAVLKADVAKLPAYVGAELPGQGYGVYRIGKITQPAQPDVARRKDFTEQISQAIGSTTTFDYVQSLKTKAKAKINVKPSDLGAKQE